MAGHLILVCLPKPSMGLEVESFATYPIGVFSKVRISILILGFVYIINCHLLKSFFATRLLKDNM